MRRVYLAGPINGCSDEEMTGWRREAAMRLKTWDVVDPSRRDYRGSEGQFAKAIVEGDKQDIDASDAVLAECSRASAGTSMEVLYAWTKGKRVVAVCPGPVSPWIAYHAEAVFSDVGQAVAYLEEST